MKLFSAIILLILTSINLNGKASVLRMADQKFRMIYWKEPKKS
jgi:hypothetical protein